MQHSAHLIVEKKSAEPGPYASTPLRKSLKGSCLDKPVVELNPKDSTRLKDEPGGLRVGDPPSSGVCNTQPSNPKPLPLSFRDAARAGISRVEAPASAPKEVKRPVSNPVTPLQIERGWQVVVRNGKPRRNTYSETSSVTSSQSYQSSDRNFPLARPVPVKRNSSASSGNPQPPARRRSVKKPPGRAPPEETNSWSEVTPCSSPIDDLKREILEIWWQILGFTRQRGPLRKGEFIRALEAFGFTTRNKDGAQVSYKPPPNFESTQGLTVHFPHRVNIEHTELKNKASTIKKQYPSMVCMLEQRYRALRLQA
ncbi:unnamed protein product [Rhizoctonia solani]|uniref:Uncharacterized protein n=1 Tax=Rhizoctonia solani TaxID=456999 RepID=A0A8H3HR04_9AGAM|nr:unnamed protein product [Rhizoctonia solani]